MDVIEEIISESVFPIKTKFKDGEIEGFGLTKREHFAAMAMQGFVSGLVASSGYEQLDNKVAANYAVKLADALIAALNKEVGS